jgi:hypothetical protein
MKDDDIDTSDIPEMSPKFFKNAILWAGAEEADDPPARHRQFGILSQAKATSDHH